MAAGAECVGASAAQRRHGAPWELCAAQIEADELTKVAKENWSSEVRAAVPPPQFRPDLVEKIYAAELGGGPTAQRLKRVMLLEISQYLENYLWPHFDAATATEAHVMSILVRGTLQVLSALQCVSPHHPGLKVVTAPPACAGHGEREVPRGCAGLGRLRVAAGRAAEPV